MINQGLKENAGHFGLRFLQLYILQSIHFHCFNSKTVRKLANKRICKFLNFKTAVVTNI